MFPRTPLVVGAVLVVAAACGTSTTDEPAAQPAAVTPETDAPRDDGGSESAATGSSEAPAGSPAPDVADDTEPDAPAEPPEPTESAVPAESTAAPSSTAATTDAEPDGMAWPDDGCSTDGSPTAVSALDGPAPEVELRSESAASSPLPPIAVRRVNCTPGWVNFQNELPADRALLVWFWAPH